MKSIAATTIIILLFSIHSFGQKYRESGFADIKRVLGVTHMTQVTDSLGKGEQNGTYLRDGVWIRIRSQNQTPYMIEFNFNTFIEFNEDTLLSKKFFDLLGLKFNGCIADTTRYREPNPVTKKVSKYFSIEYRGCAIVKARERHEDLSKYYYELEFIPVEGDLAADLEMIKLVLRKER